jgi:hypothetical protein
VDGGVSRIWNSLASWWVVMMMVSKDSRKAFGGAQAAGWSSGHCPRLLGYLPRYLVHGVLAVGYQRQNSGDSVHIYNAVHSR